LLGLLINCDYIKCDCGDEFETIETEELLNLVQHGRLSQEQTLFLKSRIGSKLCKQCFLDNHKT